MYGGVSCRYRRRSLIASYYSDMTAFQKCLGCGLLDARQCSYAKVEMSKCVHDVVYHVILGSNSVYTTLLRVHNM